MAPSSFKKIDLAPAKWLWLPSGRTLPNTVLLFRRELEITGPIKSAKGWIAADSRYLLSVNGQRVQWGPAPFDPRFQDADPVDLTSLLQAGRNVIGAEVLFFGHGDGTWPFGKPGFIFKLHLEYDDGKVEEVISDARWQCRLDRAHRPGQHKRFFLRSLQEEFDARLHPWGWDRPDHVPDSAWLPACELKLAADKPSILSDHPDVFDYFDAREHRSSPSWSLVKREIPLMTEELLAATFITSGTFHWKRDPADWFDCRVPDSFTAAYDGCAEVGPLRNIILPAPKKLKGGQNAYVASFRFECEIVGFPFVEIEAPEGTIVEIITKEGHDPAREVLMDNAWHTWSRLICRQGLSRFRALDYDAFTWIQIHARAPYGQPLAAPVKITAIGAIARRYTWAQKPLIKMDDERLQLFMDATLNTYQITSQDIVVDCIGRERQQYSVTETNQQRLGALYAFGETLQMRRFLKTWSLGQMEDGLFFDTWPAYDRLQRLWQRQFGGYWGILLSGNIVFVDDCWTYYMQTGDLETVRPIYPRLVKLIQRLKSMIAEDGLLKIAENDAAIAWSDGTPQFYQHPRNQFCLLNILAIHMLRDSLAPLAELCGDTNAAQHYRDVAEGLHRAIIEHYWDKESRMFIDNLPWAREDGGRFVSERSAAHALLYGLYPSPEDGPRLLEVLVRCSHRHSGQHYDATMITQVPMEDGTVFTMGRAFPPCTHFRFWALARHGRTDIVVEEWAEEWAALQIVKDRKALPEAWGNEWESPAHNSTSGVTTLYLHILGIAPLEPGYKRCLISPQLQGMPSFETIAHTVMGPIHFKGTRDAGLMLLEIGIPQGMTAELKLAEGGRLLEAGVHHAWIPVRERS